MAGLEHFFDPLLAVHTSVLEPLPHQIKAVYGELLPRQPLRFLLADDPGAGKTIMAGLFIKELIVRGDLKRCLVICPGSLVEQWQDELWDKFGLHFEIVTRETVENSRSGNPFAEKNLVLARLDHLARNNDIVDKLQQTDWDLVVVDEAHTMSAHYFGNEVRETNEDAYLYKEVTDYVRDEMNRAERLKAEGEGRRGAVVGFALTILQRRLAASSEAIYQSLKRRRKRLEDRLREEEVRRRGAAAKAKLAWRLTDLDEEDVETIDERPDAEVEELEEEIVDEASAAQTIEELKAEISTLARLEELARKVRNSGTDRKWEELSNLLQHQREMFDAEGARRKLTIFTEHRDTMNYLADRIRTLLGRPAAVVTIHGGMGREEVCHMWNLVAVETREGEVFKRLFDKLETQLQALGGRVFDVLGRVFTERSLRDLLIEAVRYGERPEVKAKLQEVVDRAVGEELRRAVTEQALVTDVMSAADVERIREQMEEAEARHVQPHGVEERIGPASRTPRAACRHGRRPHPGARVADGVTMGEVRQMTRHETEADAPIAIDHLVRQAGWDPADKSAVRAEVAVAPWSHTTGVVDRSRARRFGIHAPVYDLVTAAGAFGADAPVSQLPEERGWIAVPEHVRLTRDYFVARAEGRSMQPTIPNRSWCLFRADRTGSRHGKLVLVWHRGSTDPALGGEFSVKRYVSTKVRNADGTWTHSEIRLEPLNPDPAASRPLAPEHRRPHTALGVMMAVREIAEFRTWRGRGCAPRAV